MASHGGKSQPWGGPPWGGSEVGFTPTEVGSRGWMTMLQGHKAIGGPCVPKMPRALLCLSFPLSSWYNGREQWWLGRTPPPMPPCRPMATQSQPKHPGTLRGGITSQLKRGN